MNDNIIIYYIPVRWAAHIISSNFTSPLNPWSLTTVKGWQSFTTIHQGLVQYPVPGSWAKETKQVNKQ